jgi:hypothetical protein
MMSTDTKPSKPGPRPEWALAYVLQDLTRRGRPAFRQAYADACAVEEAQFRNEHVTEVERLQERAAASHAAALKRARAYVAALEAVDPERPIRA